MNIQKLSIAVLLGLYWFSSPTLQWNGDYMFDFIIKFYPMLQAQGNVWFLSPLMTTEHTNQLDSFIKRIQDASQESQYVLTNRTDIRMIRTAAKRNCMVAVFTTGADDPIMYAHNRVTTGRHFGLSLIIYVKKVRDMKEIERLCYVLYQGNFVNAMVHFQQTNGQNNLFGYEFFPHFAVENRTDFMAYVRRQYAKVMSASQDVAGYKFYTPLRQDLPHVFKFNDKFRNLQLQGTTFRIFDDFVESLNGSIVEYEMPKDNYGEQMVNMKAVLELVRSRKIDVAAHAYALYHTDDDLDKSYPIMVVQWCLMVPLENSISTFLYVLQPFEWRVWFIVLAVFWSLWCVDLFKIILETSVDKSKRKWFVARLTHAGLMDFCHVIFIATPKALQVHSVRHFLLYTALFFFGFFLSANYTSYLGSFLTVSLFREQINTIDDIVRAQLPVMIVDYELEFLLSEGYQLPADFGKLIRPVDTHTFARHQLQFNTSYAYFVTDDTWHFLDEAQKHLKQRVFKFSDICFGSYHLAYPIQTDSAVWRDLEYFLFRTHSNGLLQKYEQETFRYAVSAGYVHRLAESQEHISAGLEHLRLLFWIWGVMCGAGWISLCVEICVYKCRHGRGRLG
ncbi:uncharacterized protein [Musca autumnalis]|uniref:uncharacterized protein n=1 Tax=Musca autumnalis TaxID=221902 RepID=UPI003CF4A17F